MSDERKPVICPWCGWDMVAREGQDIFHGKYNVYVCDGCEATSPIAYSEEAAHIAATRTPPNLPLTYEQVEAMDDLDAVWIVQRYPYVNERVTIQTASWIKAQYRDLQGDEWAHRKVFFAASPTPADIEAARKEETNESPA